jgi:FkbM family methyltransferase
MIMSHLNTFKIVINHPLNRGRKFKSFWMLIKWFINTKLNPFPIIAPFAGKSKLLIQRGLTGATGNFFCGLHEFEEMAFLLHFLRPADIFVDVGANVGSYTLLGGSEVGSKVITIEPIPETFKILEFNIIMNKLQDNVTALNIGMGASKSELNFTASKGPENRVAIGNELDTIRVPIDTFDHIVDLQSPALVKIDVEGFETEVLNGMNTALLNDNLKAIIIELNGLGKQYGYEDLAIHEKLISSGFTPFKYNPFERKLIPLKLFGPHNTIYIKDIEFVNHRISNANKVKIFHHEF